MLTFSEPLRQSSRCDFDAVGVPDHYDPGTDDLPMVIREHFQLPLYQRFQILDDIGKIRRRSPRIETQISLPVLLKLLLPNLWRSAGQIPGGTDGVQTAFRRFCLSSIVSPTPRKPAAISEIISEILRFAEDSEFFG